MDAIVTRPEPDFDELIQPNRIHGSLYTSPEIFELELERIFYRTWVFVGHASEIPQPGQYVTRDIGRRAVVMVRGHDGEVRVFANRCQHRGNLLCNTARGEAKNFVCPYHGWVFGLDGQLLDVPYPGGFSQPRERYALERLQTDSYRGFVFATFNPDTVPFDDYLGRATELIDRACDLSPEGEIELRAGWIRHRYDANWKMLPENDTDGYHVNFTHVSFVRVIRSHYDEFVGNEDAVTGVIRDWGGGHTEIDFAPGYKAPLAWLGATPDKVPDYVAAMERAYGKEEAERRLWQGPPHACIFPNLFLAEMNIVIFQPLAVNRSVQWSTPMFLKGAPELDFRLLRQSEGALGPASFLVADDASIAERAQVALESGNEPWCDLSRGMEREREYKPGVAESHLTDETSNRGLWQHYRRVMTERV